MRFVVVALGALALVGIAASAGPASAAKTKMGCERGKQVWNATLGRCEAGRSKYAGVSARKPAKKGAPAAKAAPKAQAAVAAAPDQARRPAAPAYHSQRMLPAVTTKTLSCGTSRCGISRTRQLQDKAAQRLADTAVRGHDGVALDLREPQATRSDSMR